MKMLKILKQPIYTTAASILIAIVFFFIYIILSNVMSDNCINYIITIPLISGYLHVSLTHFFYNFVALFLFLLPTINNGYNYQDIYFITLMLSLLYLPFVILGFCEPAVGISGTCFFLLSRYLMSFNKIQFSLLFLSILIFLELYSIEPNDGVAHIVHFLGILTGCISIKRKSIIGISIVPYFQEKFSIQNYAIG